MCSLHTVSWIWLDKNDILWVFLPKGHQDLCFQTKTSIKIFYSTFQVLGSSFKRFPCCSCSTTCLCRLELVPLQRWQSDCIRLLKVIWLSVLELVPWLKTQTECLHLTQTAGRYNCVILGRWEHRGSKKAAVIQIELWDKVYIAVQFSVWTSETFNSNHLLLWELLLKEWLTHFTRS